MGIGLALSGGGAKGIAHIGVIEALKDYGINIEYIAGTSSGSLIASLYAAGYTPNEMLRIINRYKDGIIDIDKGIGFKLFGSVLKKRVSIKGFVKGIKLERMIEYILKEKGVEDISDLSFPIAIPTVNLKTGEITYFSNVDIDKKDNIYEDRWCLIEENTNYEDEPKYIKGGKLSSIVRASCSVPGIFVPKRIKDDIYIDGGVRVNSPIDVLRKMGADKIIVVTFNCNKGNHLGIENVIGISSQAFNIMSHESNKDKVELADVNVKLCLNNVSLLDFSNSTDITHRGYNIIARNIDKIKRSLNIKEEQGEF
ncbi:MAG: patatin-like phospholipase family protein [Clostridia bacterium]|nr:patatin-like phospholipase family protein [Clostridia bacterium]